MNDLSLGWALMGYGLAGVFTTLILFMAMIYAVVKLFPDKEDNEDSRYHQ